MFCGNIVGRGGCGMLGLDCMIILKRVLNCKLFMTLSWLMWYSPFLLRWRLLNHRMYVANLNNYGASSKDLVMTTLLLMYNFFCCPGSASRSWCLACMLLVLLTLTGVGVVLPLTTRLRHGFHNFDYLSAVRSMLRDVPLVDGWVSNLALFMVV